MWVFIPGLLVMFVGTAYVVLEYIPSIEPPANMRYVRKQLHSELGGENRHI
jgi:hypothetical protein